mmetsp:Transcript_61642/g.198561  ORF Transcript_61642/g.198561 Transcript_61642/m.198561 type:complete len:488 (-) Transcript_61642:10-1473(-)
MLASWLNPVQHCCCTPGHNVHWLRGGRFGANELLEEMAPGEVTGSAAEILVDTARSQEGFRGALPVGPRERMVPTYATAEDERLQGEPLYSGNILQLTLGESIHEMQLALHVNGFSLTPCDTIARGTPRPISRAWSPFSLVEKCQVKTMQHSAYWAVFKLTVFRKEGQDRCYYFATTGCDAYKERDRWVLEMVTAIGNVTMSLFPPHAITVDPLPGVATTSTRIMAGYLLQSGTADNVCLFYCELHAYSHGEARLAVYHDEWCEQEVSSVQLADSSTVSTRKGAYCTVFGVDQHRFCARTKEEKDLWLRAVSNVKVKLMFDAPDPTDEELQMFRAAVHERVGELQEKQGTTLDPLLAPVQRAPPMSPRGDAWDPDPIEDAADPPAAGEAGGAGDAAALAGRRLNQGALGPEECRRLLQGVSSGLSEAVAAGTAASRGVAAGGPGPEEYAAVGDTGHPDLAEEPPGTADDRPRQRSAAARAAAPGLLL